MAINGNQYGKEITSKNYCAKLLIASINSSWFFQQKNEKTIQRDKILIHHKNIEDRTLINFWKLIHEFGEGIKG